MVNMDFLDLSVIGSRETQEFYAEKSCQREIYEDEESLRRRLMMLLTDRDQIDSVIDHERAHLQTARQLGYDVNYCLSLQGNEILPSISFVGGAQVMPASHFRKILLAPENPSQDDLIKLEALEAFVRGEK